MGRILLYRLKEHSFFIIDDHEAAQICTYTSEEPRGFIFVLYQITNFTRKNTKESNWSGAL